MGLRWWLRWSRICLQCGRPRFNPWVGTISWRRKWQPLQYSCLENPMDGGAWQATVHGVTKSRPRLSDFTFTFIPSVHSCSIHSFWWHFYIYLFDHMIKSLLLDSKLSEEGPHLLLFTGVPPAPSTVLRPQEEFNKHLLSKCYLFIRLSQLVTRLTRDSYSWRFQ